MPELRIIYSCSNSFTPSERISSTPFARILFCANAATSLSKGARIWSDSSTSIVFNPAWIKFSAISTPINPPPTTTAFLASPLRKISFIPSPSLRVLTVKIFLLLIPVIGGITGVAPVASTSLSYDNVSVSFTVTVFDFLLISVTRELRRTSIFKRFLNRIGLETIILPREFITSDV